MSLRPSYLDVLTLLLVFMVLMLSSADFRENLVQALAPDQVEVQAPPDQLDPEALPGPLQSVIANRGLAGFVDYNRSSGTPDLTRLVFKTQIMFEPKSAQLTPESIDILHQIYQFALSNLDLDVHLLGHANDGDGETVDRRLSVVRALAVSNFLEKRGLPSTRMTLIELGSRRNSEVSSNPDISHNRRLQIMLVLPDGREN